MNSPESELSIIFFHVYYAKQGVRKTLAFAGNRGEIEIQQKRISVPKLEMKVSLTGGGSYYEMCRCSFRANFYHFDA